YFNTYKSRRNALNFCKNSSQLIAKGLQAPIICDLVYCTDLKVYVVVYQKLSGENLRLLLKKNPQHLLKDLALFLAHLHQIGVFFRSLHLENLLYQPDKNFALI